MLLMPPLASRVPLDRLPEPHHATKAPDVAMAVAWLLRPAARLGSEA